MRTRRKVRLIGVAVLEPYNAPDGPTCEVWLTGWGTDAPIEEVVAAYEGIGFKVRGRPGTVDDEGNFDPDGELIRWVGDGGADENDWRKVDIATGAVAGHPEWATAVLVSAPACDGLRAGEPPRPPSRRTRIPVERGFAMMSPIRAIGAAALIAAAACGPPELPASPGGDRAEQTTARIVCRVDGSTELLTPRVTVRPDGLHVSVRTLAGEPVSVGGLAVDAEEGMSEHVSMIPPGEVGVACWP